MVILRERSPEVQREQLLIDLDGGRPGSFRTG